DHLLGVTFVTGDGRLVHSGGRVVKNVAGYDLTRLEAGAFGAFGVIVLIHLRLRALPRADQTLALEGSREDLTQVAEDIAAAGIQPAAHELMSPALARRERWLLAVRFAGSAAPGAARPPPIGSSACVARSPASKYRSPWSAPPGPCAAPSVTSVRTVRGWDRSSPDCGGRSIPARRSWWRPKALNDGSRGVRRARPLRALRFLPPGVPHVSRDWRRSRQPARPHRADARARGGRARPGRPRPRAAPRSLPRLPGVR